MSKRWSGEEEISLTNAWIAVSEKFEIGKDLSLANFWLKVWENFKIFESSRGVETARTFLNDRKSVGGAIKKKWDTLNIAFNRFHGFLELAFQNRSASDSDEDCWESARRLFFIQDRLDKGKKQIEVDALVQQKMDSEEGFVAEFKCEPSYRLVMGHPKWLENDDPAIKRKAEEQRKPYESKQAKMAKTDNNMTLMYEKQVQNNEQAKKDAMEMVYIETQLKSLQANISILQSDITVKIKLSEILADEKANMIDYIREKREAIEQSRNKVTELMEELEKVHDSSINLVVQPTPMQINTVTTTATTTTTTTTTTYNSQATPHYTNTSVATSISLL